MCDWLFLLQSICSFYTLCVIFPAMLIAGGYLTYRLRGVQIFQMKKSFQYLVQKNGCQEDSISHFEAVSTVLAGNFGTGNISGMAMAFSLGGPGALVWMWVMAFFGSAIQYASCFLAGKYRSKEKRCVGGPMYYLQAGAQSPKVAALFAAFAICAAFTAGNFVQIHSMTLPLKTMGCPPLFSGGIFAFFVAVVLLGGGKRFAHIASSLVPFMALLYFGAALVILIKCNDSLLGALQLMLQAAIQPQSALSGFAGFGMAKALTTGFERGVFATDAGTGIVPVLQSSAVSKHPAVDAVVSLAAPLLVMIICTVTGLVLIVTGAYQTDLQSTDMCAFAFEKGLSHPVGGYIVTLSLLLFGYTTILAWASCAKKATAYLFSAGKARGMMYAFIALIPLGGCWQIDCLWLLADLSIMGMLSCNLWGVFKLMEEVINGSRLFFPPFSRPKP